MENGRIAIGPKLGIALLVCALGAAGYAGYSEMRYDELGEALAADLSTYSRQRWARAPLRGSAQEGNAAELAAQLIAKLPALPAAERDAVAQHLYYVTALDPDQKRLISEHRVTLARLRAATRAPHAMNVFDLRRGAGASFGDYPKTMDAALLLLATGLSYDASDCLELGADVIRMSQDLVPGAPLEAASVAMRITSVATPLITSCAARADENALRKASREFHVLATTPPPVGTGIELSDILTRVALLEQGNAFDGGKFSNLWSRGPLFDAWHYLDNPSRWRKLWPTEYPASLEQWKSEQDYRSRASEPRIAHSSAGVLGWLYDDMRGQALLRALTVGLATLAERAEHKRLPSQPVGLKEPALRDPFSGSALRHRVADDGGELVIWSVGEDLRDDGGATDWAPEAPIDVVVRFKLRSEAAAAPARDKRPPRRIAPRG